MKKYDLVFGLGRACACTQVLRKANLQLLSFPWDWLTSDRSVGPDIRLRADSICAGFNDWFTPEDLEPISGVQGATHVPYRSRSTHVVYLHDFPEDVPFAAAFPAIKAKYERRTARLRSLLESSREALAVCLDLPGLCAPTSLEDIRYARQRLAERFPGTHFDFVFFAYEAGRNFADRLTETMEDGILRITFDFRSHVPGRPDYDVDLERLAELLRERFAVRDYRSKGEIAAQKRRIRAAKMREAGVQTMLQYRLLHLKRRWLALKSALSPRILLARRRQKKFAHIIMLGSNCEPAFRFCRRWGFVDSSLFAWATVNSTERLAYVMRHLDDVCAGPLTLNPVRMWICGNTGIRIHGRMKNVPSGTPPPPAAAVEADRADLLGRVAHLREKLRRQAADGESTLFVYHLPSDDAERPGLAKRLEDIENSFRELGARNWKFLVIAERRMVNRVPDGPDRFVRSVGAFNPTNAVTDARLGDPVGWQAIFTEFAPVKILKKTKKFKFEN